MKLKTYDPAHVSEWVADSITPAVGEHWQHLTRLRNAGVLRHRASGMLVLPGQPVREGKATITGWDYPHKPSSSGRIYLKHEGAEATRSLFPHVEDMEVCNSCFDHVTDAELRTILCGVNHIGPEELKFAAQETAAAFTVDSVAGDVDPNALAEREHHLAEMEAHWGTGEDGDSRAFAAIQRFWLA